VFRSYVGKFDMRNPGEPEQQAQGQSQEGPQIEYVQDNHQPNRELEQLKVVSNYITFHMGLYLATPPVLVILAEGLGVVESGLFISGFFLMIILYLVSGISAGWFMGKFINHPWTDNRLRALYAEAYSGRRRILHHWVYWAGLVVGLIALVMAYVLKNSAV
jgi:hypothetical protein